MRLGTPASITGRQRHRGNETGVLVDANIVFIFGGLPSLALISAASRCVLKTCALLLPPVTAHLTCALPRLGRRRYPAKVHRPRMPLRFWLRLPRVRCTANTAREPPAAISALIQHNSEPSGSTWILSILVSSCYTSGFQAAVLEEACLARMFDVWIRGKLI